MLVLVLLPLGSWSQPPSPPQPQPHSPAARPAMAGTEPWEFSLTLDGYLIEGQNGYAQPTFTADHKWLHLEARYNYENFRIGSLWGGYNFSWGKTWQFKVTPMIGAVFGPTNGVAPGCEASVSWKVLELSIDNEYVFDTTSKSGNLYYSWPQLTTSPIGWFRFGAVAQHTKVFETKLDVQRGFFVGFHHEVGGQNKELEFTTYVFDPGSNATTVVLEVGANF